MSGMTMNVDDILKYYKAGTISHDHALAWITIQIERAAVMAKLEMIDKIEADIDLIQPTPSK